MIPNRAPEHKRHCLTMYAYQTMPMIPPKPSNIEQRQVVAKAAQLADKCPTLPKKVSTRSKTLAEGHTARIQREVKELFAAGPLTVNMVQEKLGLAIRESAGRKVHEWRDRGLIVERKPRGKQPAGKKQKWWTLAPNAELTGASGAVAAKRPVE